VIGQDLDESFGIVLGCSLAVAGSGAVRFHCRNPSTCRVSGNRHSVPESVVSFPSVVILLFSLGSSFLCCVYGFYKKVVQISIFACFCSFFVVFLIISFFCSGD